MWATAHTKANDASPMNDLKPILFHATSATCPCFNATKDRPPGDPPVRACLRALRHRLEDEALTTVNLHAMDLQSLGAQMLAQRQAMVKCLAADLVTTENSLTLATRTLAETVAQHATELQALHEEIERLKSDAEAARARLAEEVAARECQVSALQTELSDLQASSAAAQQELSMLLTISLREHATDVSLLRSDLLAEEATCVEMRVTHHNVLSRMEREWSLEVVSLQRELELEMLARKEKEALLEDHLARLQLAEAAVARQGEEHGKEKESMRQHLQSRIDAQASKLSALRASTARGRAMKYWSSMKSTREKQIKEIGMDSLDLSEDEMMLRVGWAEWRPPTREPEEGSGVLWRPPPGGCG